MRVCREQPWSGYKNWTSWLEVVSQMSGMAGKDTEMERVGPVGEAYLDMV